MPNVFLYTIHHTGTRLLEQFFETAFASDVFVMDLISYGLSKQEALYSLESENRYPRLEVTDLDLYAQDAYRLTKGRELQDNVVCILRHHKRKPQSRFQQLIDKSDIGIPIVIPLRDPLLSLNGYLWRIYGNGLTLIRGTLDYQQRVKITNSWIAKYLAILDSPADVHLLPIDIPEMESLEKRVSSFSNMLEYCKLPLTEEARRFLSEWKVVGAIQDSSLVKQNGNSYLAEHIKKSILTKDVSFVSSNLPIEFEYLNRNEALKEKLYKVGYRDLVWW